ncbi:MAG: hypothetical protein EOP04_28740 [Proteobacteria bacterium]|nr:MAG: hypothetical protein EOP04_28740 [Pseudomonadota bacterium]
MSTFIARVQLFDVFEDDPEHQDLDERMADRGFLKGKEIEGNWYNLPSGEYIFEGQRTIDAIRKLAKGAADSTGKKSKIMIAEVTDIVIDDARPRW